MIYKQQSIIKQLPTCDFTLNDLNELIDICIRLHQDCKSTFIGDVKNKRFNLDGISADNEVAIKEHVDSNFFWMIEIHGDRGEYLNVMDLTKLQSADLPLRIQKISIGNQFMYHFKTSTHPSVHFNISIDFKTNRIFDLISSPSRSTENGSTLEISGTNSVTVLGLAAEFESFFKKHSNLNGIINGENTYDVLLWLGFLPLTLFYLTKYHEFIPERILNSPLPIQIMFSIVVFFQNLLMFRLTFNFARWFFPCQELRTQTSSYRKIAKYIYSTAITGIIGTLAFNIVSWLAVKLNS